MGVDSDDKKDIIRTVKKKSEEGGEDVENTDEEEFDFEVWYFYLAKAAELGYVKT